MTAEMTLAPEPTAGEGWLILRVAMPRLAARLDRLNAWLDRYAPERHVDAADELRSVSGAEGLALLAAVPPDRRAGVLARLGLPDEEFRGLQAIAERLGDASDDRSTAAGLVRMMPLAEEAALDVTGDLRGIAALLVRAEQAYREGELRFAYDRAQRCLERLRAGEEFADHSLAGDALRMLGLVSDSLGERKQAVEFYEQALALARDNNDLAGEAATRHQLANIDVSDGKYAAAREKFAQSLRIAQQVRDRVGEAATWHQLASIDLREGTFAEAREKFARSLAINQQLGDRSGEAATWHQLASIDLREGNTPAAREKFARSLTIKQQIGNRAGEAATLFQLGTTARKQDRLLPAAKLVGLCFTIFRAIGDERTQLVWQNLLRICDQLSLTQEHVSALLQEVAASYEQDRGASLLREAFPDS